VCVPLTLTLTLTLTTTLTLILILTLTLTLTLPLTLPLPLTLTLPRTPTATLTLTLTATLTITLTITLTLTSYHTSGAVGFWSYTWCLCIAYADWQPLGWGDRDCGGTVRVFRQKFTFEDAIGSHACSLEANTRVTNGIPFGSSLLLPVDTVNCIQTLKASVTKGVAVQVFERSTVLFSPLQPDPPPSNQGIRQCSCFNAVRCSRL
jgi:hypothetical protein